MKCPNCRKKLTVIIATKLGRHYSYCDNNHCKFLGIERLILIKEGKL